MHRRGWIAAKLSQPIDGVLSSVDVLGGSLHWWKGFEEHARGEVDDIPPTTSSRIGGT